MRIQVVLADKKGQEIFECDVASASRVEYLLKLENVINFIKRNKDDYSISISGEKVSSRHYLKPYDRVVLLRPLKMSPKEWRRSRVKKVIKANF